jgi:hypothetical protein
MKKGEAFLEYGFQCDVKLRIVTMTTSFHLFFSCATICKELRYRFWSITGISSWVKFIQTFLKVTIGSYHNSSLDRT